MKEVSASPKISLVDFTYLGTVYSIVIAVCYSGTIYSIRDQANCPQLPQLRNLSPDTYPQIPDIAMGNSAVNAVTAGAGCMPFVESR